MAKKTEQPKEVEYTKMNLLSSKRYSHNRDILNVILNDDKTYNLNEVDKLIEDFYKKKFK